jgi:hypothetical protein
MATIGPPSSGVTAGVGGGGMGVEVGNTSIN